MECVFGIISGPAVGVPAWAASCEKSESWCPREDSNLHDLAITSS